jgi:hypothetical protein
LQHLCQTKFGQKPTCSENVLVSSNRVQTCPLDCRLVNKLKVAPIEPPNGIRTKQLSPAAIFMPTDAIKGALISPFWGRVQFLGHRSNDPNCLR